MPDRSAPAQTQGTSNRRNAPHDAQEPHQHDDSSAALASRPGGLPGAGVGRRRCRERLFVIKKVQAAGLVLHRRPRWLRPACAGREGVTRLMAASRDVVIVGGGHNGLVAAAYLARNGLDTLVCEQRDVVGGAAVSEHPFGPDYTVTSLSYVVSLLPPDLVRDLRLASHGYHVFPQGPYFAPRADGRYLRLPHDPAERSDEIAKFSARDAAAYDRYEAHLAGIGAILGPMLGEIPPRLGSRRPQDLWRQGLLLRHLRKLDTRSAVDVTRLLTGSIADLVEGYFESDALRGLLAVSGVIGT